MPRKKSDSSTTPADAATESRPRAARKTPARKSAPEGAEAKPAARAPRRKPGVQSTAPVALAPEAAADTTNAELIDWLRRGDLESRCAAAARLGEIGDAAAATALAEALRDPTAELAAKAAAALGGIVDSSALHALIAVVLNGDGYFHPSVRAAASMSLGQLADERAIDALCVAVRDVDAEPSLAAVRALGAIGDGRARPILEAAQSNFDGFFVPEVRQAAADALAALRS